MKNIWITGASSGIGKALAIKFAKEGWQVAASASRENLLKELGGINNNIHPFPLDVTDSEKCKGTFTEIINKSRKYSLQDESKETPLSSMSTIISKLNRIQFAKGMSSIQIREHLKKFREGQDLMDELIDELDHMRQSAKD